MQDSEKKRARDRRAQQNLRDRRLAHVKFLEERVSVLENELRLARHAPSSRLHCNVTSCTCTCYASDADDADATRPRVATTMYEAKEVSTAQPSLPRGGLPLPAAAVNNGQQPADTNFQVVIQPERPQLLDQLTIPRWYITPLHLKSDLLATDIFASCIRKPDQVRASPEMPMPAELVYGSKRNFLANVIFEGTRKWPCRDPERLAGGWLAYKLIKWMVEPTEDRFNRLYEFQRPVAEQLCYPHPYFVDFFMLPQLRANLVKKQHMYQTLDVIGLLTCCLKVHWPWNKPMLEPDDEGQLQMRAEFLDTFTRIEGWGITKEFATMYPHLVEGADMYLFEFATI